MQQGFVVFVGEVVGVIGPFRMVGGLGDKGNGTVILAVAALVAEPPGFIAGFLGYVDDGS